MVSHETDDELEKLRAEVEDAVADEEEAASLASLKRQEWEDLTGEAWDK